MKKLSVIVPVYNVEDYITECLQSLSMQDYQDIEFICVDDGSTDSSGNICKLFSKTDKRFIYIKTQNRGVSAARNTGIKAATGEYIGFCDPDDYISYDYYSELMKNIITFGADVCVSRGVCILYPNGSIFDSSPYVSIMQDITGNTKIIPENNFDMLYKNYMVGMVWNKIFKKNLFKDCLFDETLSTYEDVEIWSRMSHNIEKFCNSKNGKYFYRVRKGSLSRNRLADLNDLEDIYAVFEKSKRACGSDDVKQRIENEKISKLCEKIGQIATTASKNKYNESILYRMFKDSKIL